MQEFSAKQLQEHLASHSPTLIDVRQQWEFDICKLEGSQLIPMSQLPSRLDELDPDEQIVIICHHGVRSRMMGRFLESAGFSDVINLSSGVDGWAKEVDSTMPTY